MSDPRILDAFRLMWGLFPEPVMLVRRDRTVLAVNALAARMGIAAGIKCHSLGADPGPDGHCRRCQAGAALRSGTAVCSQEAVGDHPVRGYWVPLDGAPDLFIHFGIGMAEAGAAARASGCQA